MNKNQIVTLTFFRFVGFKNRWWAFQQMGFSKKRLRHLPGMSFGKMLGSGGGNGFDKMPNFGVYGLLGVWEDSDAAQHFFETPSFFGELGEKASEHWTIFLHTYAAHGKWEDVAPFQMNTTYREGDPVAVLTRATIRTRHLRAFWKATPAVSHSLEAFLGKIFAIGIGELPLVQQVTFSLWENSQAMKMYAYESHLHPKVIQQTHQQGWFKEALFARFVPYATQGTWEGKNPLENYLNISSMLEKPAPDCE